MSVRAMLLLLDYQIQQLFTSLQKINFATETCLPAIFKNNPGGESSE
jgi:hypothetical protein